MLLWLAGCQARVPGVDSGQAHETVRDFLLCCSSSTMRTRTKRSVHVLRNISLYPTTIKEPPSPAERDEVPLGLHHCHVRILVIKQSLDLTMVIQFRIIRGFSMFNLSGMLKEHEKTADRNLNSFRERPQMVCACVGGGCACWRFNSALPLVPALEY